MKNHIAFKFIAIVLCAASLMGAIGSAAGIMVLTEGDLYNKTVDQMLQTQAEEYASDFATWLARNYASTELGGCSDDMVQEHYGNHWFNNRYDPEYYGYAILDENGAELLSYQPEVKNDAKTYTYPVSGNYIHLVLEESEAEIRERETEKRIQAYGDDMVVDAQGNVIPAEGAVVTQVLFVDMQGAMVMEAFYDGETVVTYYEGSHSNSNVLPDTQLGYLFCNSNGNLMFHSFFRYQDFAPWFRETGIREAYLSLENGSYIRLIDEAQVGTLYLSEEGKVVFLSEQTSFGVETGEAAQATEAEAVTEETVQETVEATVPETLPPEETEAVMTTEETSPPETHALEETVPSYASGIPEETTYEEQTQAAESTEAAAEVKPAIIVPAETVPAETTAPTVPEETTPETEAPGVPVIINGKPLDEYQLNTVQYYNSQEQTAMTAQYIYLPMPEVTVEVYIGENALVDASVYHSLEAVRQVRGMLLPGVAVCLLVFAVLTVYLCTAAGRKPGSEEVAAGGLNRIPLDLYLFGGGFLAALFLAYGVMGAEALFRRSAGVAWSVLGGSVFLGCLIFVGFLFAFVAQIKTPGGFWWRNTLCGIGIRAFMRFAQWLERFLAVKGFPFLSRVCKAAWLFIMKSMVWLYKTTEKALLWLGEKLGKFLRFAWKSLHRFLTLLPLTWQWLIAGVVSILASLMVQSDNTFFVLLGIFIPLAITLYGAHCYGILAESTRRMSKGDLSTKVDDKLMVGCFKESAADLSALADVAVVAAQKQLKSERMKTELITNVSHDIKTPLTSIINYVDLLQKPHTDAEQEQYLEVLDRQSQRLKKLIDDLMDMSKANTGNMVVEITTVDAVESVNQALGEFADKLDKAHLIPVFRHGEESVTMMADGRLVWRVMSNLLSNAVKYAMPGTRLYVDLAQLDDSVVISLKNISREELNIDADELMERFVRGDDARNTEGSGLGLNIAKSLMELQKGQLQLLVDGDLFKVTLIFPGV